MLPCRIRKLRACMSEVGRVAESTDQTGSRRTGAQTNQTRRCRSANGQLSRAWQRGFSYHLYRSTAGTRRSSRTRANTSPRKTCRNRIGTEPGRPLKLNHSQTDKLVHQAQNRFIATNNLLVKVTTGVPWDTAKDDHHRFTRCGSRFLRFCEIVVNPGVVILLLVAIFDHHSIARFLAVRGIS
jgi:hypothetical protein